MNNLSGYHKYLLAGKITQTLTDEEAAELESLFDKSPDLRQTYTHLQQKFPTNWLENGFGHIKSPEYWVNIENKLSPPARIYHPQKLLYWISAAAIVIGVSHGWWLFNFSNKNKVETSLASNKNSTIQLKLANGEIINLNEQMRVIETTSGTFTNKNNALSYIGSGDDKNGINSVYVPAGKDYKIILNDGSQVFLNSMSRIDFPSGFSGKSRQITLSGEAYLEIAKDASKPFIVHLPGISVQVLGTEFNVNTYDSGNVKVSLVSGSVNIKTLNNQVKLTPGKEAINILNKGIIQRNFDAKKVLGWKQGLYYYDGDGLREISKIIERWFGVKTVIDNPLLYQKVFVGVLDKNQPLQVFLDDLHGMSKIKPYFDKGGVLHFE